MSKVLEADEFVEQIEKATRQAGFQVKGHEGLILKVEMGEHLLRCNLATAYRAYRNAPYRLDDVIQAHLSALRQVPPMPALPAVEQMATTLLPLLNQVGRLDTLQGPELPPPIYRPHVGGLIVTYVLDSPQHMAYVNQRVLASMNQVAPMTVDQLHEIALNNLRKRTQSKDVQVHGAGDRRLITVTAGDGYTATRVLLPDLLEEWARRLPGRMLIGIPNSEFLIAFSDRDPLHVAAITRQVRKDAMRMHKPLTGRLLVWHDGRLREFQPMQ